MEIESRKFSIFLENLKMADRRNELEQKNGGSAVHGITQFSDLSQAEFESHFLTADVKMRSPDSGLYTPISFEKRNSKPRHKFYREGVRHH